MITAGRVTVNGAAACLGDAADPALDEIKVDGALLPSKQEYVYIMLNKPRGFVTTLSDEKGRPNAAQLVADCGTRVYPVGRLDMDSEGLLIFTNDGDFANMLMHPKHEVEKTYDIWVTGYNPGCFKRLGEPMELDGYRLKKPGLKLLKTEGGNARIRITIHEGRNRQVRRMCEIAGMHVTRLRRIREGKLELGDLPKGKWRYLNSEDLERLK
jgi:23S rRNA pseudouridine2605 synthase